MVCLEVRVSAIVLDLDGTLLNSDKEISCRNYQAIENILSKDIPVIFATARPPRTVKLLLPSSLL